MSMFTLQDARAQFTLTDAAAAKVKTLIEAEDTPGMTLRVAVLPGACSGFTYELISPTVRDSTPDSTSS